MQKQGISAFLALLSATVRGSNGTMIMRLANHEGMRLAYDKDEIKLPRKAGSLSIRSKILFKHCRPVVLWIDSSHLSLTVGHDYVPFPKIVLGSRPFQRSLISSPDPEYDGKKTDSQTYSA